MERVSATLQKICSDVANLSKAAIGNENDGTFDGLVGLSKFGAIKNRSLVAIKEEQAEKARLLQRAEHEAAMLPDFIRLVDYIAVESLVELAINTNKDLLAELTKPRKAGLFETMVRFTDEVSKCVDRSGSGRKDTYLVYIHTYIHKHTGNKLCPSMWTTTNSARLYLRIHHYHCQLSQSSPLSQSLS